MNDDELDLWLSTHNEQFDAQINERTNLESRRRQVRSATASGPDDDETELAEIHTIWSAQGEPARPRRRGRVRRARTRRTRPTKRPPTRGSVAAPKYKRMPVDATRSLAVILAVLCLLVFSAVVGDFGNQRRAAPPPLEQGKSMVIGVPADMTMTRQKEHTGFAQALADWLADDQQYSPVTFFTFSDLGYGTDYPEMLRQAQVDMFLTPAAITGHHEASAFVGPYLLTEGGVLVRADNSDINSIEDLDDKRVCTWSESTYREQAGRLGNSTLFENDYLSSCIAALLGGGVDAVVGDQILLSQAAEVEDREKLTVVRGATFGGQQRYGIELLDDNVGECDAIRDALRRFITSGEWDRAFMANMPDMSPAAYRPNPDDLDRCE